MARLASQWSPFPSEVFDCVLEQLGPGEQQPTACALLQAIPTCGLSPAFLWRHVLLRGHKQIQAVVRRLGRAQADADEKRTLMRSVRLLDWLPDDFVAANLLSSCSSVRQMDLRIGPRWQPEALEEALMVPFMQLRRLSLRFNLSTPTKNYYSFHAGLYFDTVLERALCSWPAMPQFKSFSFVQDLPPIEPPTEIEEVVHELGRVDLNKPKEKGYFAQPLVLFRHSFAIAAFASSEIAQHIKHLRIRLPHRSVLVPLSHPQTSTTVLPTANSKAFPRLELLDISTTFILPEALRSCLLHHVSLKHLIVDRTNLLDVEEPELAALSLGRVIAVLSLTRVTAIARAFRGMQQAREANATAAARRGGQTSRSPPQREAPAAADLPARLIIVPYASNIRSFSIGSDTVNHEAMATAFQKGWQAGLVSLKEALDERVGQVRRSSSKGEEYRLVRLRLVDEPRPFYDLANAFDDFCQRFNLVPCTMALLESRYLAVQESACVFCSVPDCCAQGGIVFPTPEDTRFQSTAALDASGWQRPASEHTPECGHLLARQIWST